MANFAITPTETSFNIQVGENTLAAANSATAAAAIVESIASLDVDAVAASIFRKNLLNPAAVTTGFFVNNVTGLLQANASYWASDFIPVKEGESYTVSYKHFRAWYDADQVFISGANDTGFNATLVAPAGAAFLRLSVTFAVVPVETFIVTPGTEMLLEYVGYDDTVDGSALLPGSVAERALAGDAVTPAKASFLQQGKNLYNKATNTLDSGQGSGGVIVAAGRQLSDFIPITPGVTYTYTPARFRAVFDAAKVNRGLPFSTNTDGSTSYTAVAGDAFMRLTHNDALVDSAQVEVGEVATSYEPFGFKLTDDILLPAPSGIGVAGLPAPTVRRARAHETIALDINHHLMNGQSNSVRGGAYLPVADATDLAFSGGIDLRAEETANTLVGIGSVTAEHAVIRNAMQQLKFLIQGSTSYAGDPDYLAGRYPLLISSHGAGGASIAGLSKDGLTGCYEDAMHGVAEGARIAAATGKAHGIQSLSWLQGETDRGLSVAAYKAAFFAMLADYRADIAAATAQPHDFITFVVQPSGQQFDATAGEPFPNRVAQAFFEASEEDARVLIFGTTYPLGHVDDLHYDTGYVTLGMQLGKALYKRTYRGEDWRPVEPVRITKHSARVVTVKFHVPEAPLVFDTVNVTNPGDFGFAIEDAGGFVTISSVQLVGPDTVRITTSADIGASPLLSYAYYGTGGEGGGPNTGARGNLRDSDPTIGVNGEENLWNWACAFQKPINYVRGAP